MINSNDKKFNIWDKPTYLASQMPLQRNMALRYSYRETQAMISIQKKPQFKCKLDIQNLRVV